MASQEVDYDEMYDDDDEEDGLELDDDEGEQEWSGMSEAYTSQPQHHGMPSHHAKASMSHDPLYTNTTQNYSAQYSHMTSKNTNYANVMPGQIAGTASVAGRHEAAPTNTSSRNSVAASVSSSKLPSVASSSVSISAVTGSLPPNYAIKDTKSNYSHNSFNGNNSYANIYNAPTSSVQFSNSGAFSNAGGNVKASSGGKQIQKSNKNSSLFNQDQNETNKQQSQKQQPRTSTHSEQTQSVSKMSVPSRSQHSSSPYSRVNEQSSQYNKEKSSSKDGRNDDSQGIMFKISQARNELKNLRQSVRGLRSQHKNDVAHLENLIEYSTSPTTRGQQENGNKATEKPTTGAEDKDVDEPQPRMDPLFQNWKPIGFMESAYMHKNGTPRQGCLVAESKGRIRILDALYNNAHHSLHGLDQYSHVWLIFVFHQNSTDPSSSGSGHMKAKVAPPRLGGAKLGVFATRSPHRPNPIGITLAKLDAVEGSTVHVSGVDILFGTPILDIKPYIPAYDAPVTDIGDITREDIMKTIRNASSTSNVDSKTGITKMDITANDHLDGSYLNLSNVNCKDVNGKASSSNTPCNRKTLKNGIIIEKLTSTAGYEHLLKLHFKPGETPENKDPSCKINDDSATNMESSSKTSDEVVRNGKDCGETGAKVIGNSAENAGSTKEIKLSTSEQLRNAKNESKAIEGMKELMLNGNKTEQSNDEVRTADWLKDADNRKLEVIFNPIAEKQIASFSKTAEEQKFRLEYIEDAGALRALIKSSVCDDLRSQYRRTRCPDLLYHFTTDGARITAAFVEEGVVEVLRVTPQ
uniref:tRNA (Adenine(37)-N6)-methyltransferase-like n=1 Tax=Hirondellea gigas TaxID=1518452 RepID=A0A2P2I027_9CRUS